jgi:hypothetical protein
MGVAFDGRSTGEGYVVLRSDADLKRCMAHDRQKMQSRYIELFPSTRSDMEAATRRSGGRDRSECDVSLRWHRFLEFDWLGDLTGLFVLGVMFAENRFVPHPSPLPHLSLPSQLPTHRPPTRHQRHLVVDTCLCVSVGCHLVQVSKISSISSLVLRFLAL